MTSRPHAGAGAATSAHHDPAAAGESIGAMLAGLRLARGFSQLRLAELLCAAAGTPTISRHEVSRWEREERVPGRFWRGWLAVVLDTPLDALEAAAAATAAGRHTPAAGTDPHRLWQLPTAADLLAALDRADGTDVRLLAHAWLAGPPAPPVTPPRRAGGPDPTGPADRLVALRRMDDLVGGGDLAARVDRGLRAVIDALPERPQPAAVRRVAEWAQLAGWVHADAGDIPRAERAWTAGLRAAAASGDHQIAGHVLGSLSHQRLAVGHPQEALLLARTAYHGARHRASARCRALLLHRVALACAHVGERRAAHRALAEAERIAGRARPEREPEWLYWLDDAELAAMTGRCLAASGRPMRAAPLLDAVPASAGPRAGAVYAGWRARSYLDLGEVERACEIAAHAWVGTVRTGSARAAEGLRQLHPALLRHRDVPAVRGYQQLAAAATDYLPTYRQAAARPRTGRAADARQRRGSVAL